MAITINGSGTIAGLSAGGLPDASIQQADLASPVVGNGPAFSAYVASNQSISSSTNVKIPFNTEEFDTNSNYDNATNYRFTPTVAGYYQINSAIGSIAGSTRAFAMIYKNGSEFKRGNDSSASVNSVALSSLVYANGSTDYFEIYLYTNVGGTNLGGGNNISYFQASLVRAA